MHRAVVVPARNDLRPFLKILQAYQLPHHVTEESGMLVIWAPDENQAGIILSAWERWQEGALQVPGSSEPAFSGQEGNEQGPERASAQGTTMVPVKSLLQGFISALWVAPVTVLLIVACVLVAAISQLGADVMAVRSLFFPDVAGSGEFPLVALFAGLDSPSAWLRTLTPALLHFGPVHLVFNMLWLWFFGRMMEQVLGKSIYLLLILVMAFSANVLQYLWSGSVNFGGMSGVVYGQLGFIWMWQSMRPASALRLPLPMIMVFLVALVLMEILASSMIASAAHLGGLLSGMLCGLLMAVVFKRLENGRG